MVKVRRPLARRPGADWVTGMVFGLALVGIPAFYVWAQSPSGQRLLREAHPTGLLKAATTSPSTPGTEAVRPRDRVSNGG